MEDWLAANLPEGARVGIDPWLHTVDAVRRLSRKLTESGKSVLPLAANPVDTVWSAERPALPDAPLRVHALEWAGCDVASKLAKLRKQVRYRQASRAWPGARQRLMRGCTAWCHVDMLQPACSAAWRNSGALHGRESIHAPCSASHACMRLPAPQMVEARAGALLVTALDEVAWLTNLRGSDVDFNPVFLAYALVTAVSKAFACLGLGLLSVSSRPMLKCKAAGMRMHWAPSGAWQAGLPGADFEQLGSALCMPMSTTRAHTTKDPKAECFCFSPPHAAWHLLQWPRRPH